MISGLKHFAFCRRRWALIHIEQLWCENALTQEGHYLHERVHDPNFTQLRGSVLLSRAMPVRSEALHITGECDMVELHRDPNGVPIHGRTGLWRLYPVEYKHGKPDARGADELQLCAQAMCLEEMFVTEIPEGSVYYAEAPAARSQCTGRDARAARARIHTARQNDARLQKLLHGGAVPARAERARLSRRICPACIGGRNMKRLQNTLYVTTPEAYLSLDGETVVVRNDDDVLGRVPLHNLEAIVSFGYRGVSPALMRACTERNIGLCFLSRHGRFLARVSGPVQGNVLLRTEQYRTADDRKRALPIAKMLLTGKLYNSRWLLEHFRRDHPQRLDLTAVGAGIDQIKSSLRLLPEAADHDMLRGIEGSAAKAYFSVFPQLILRNAQDFPFSGRSRRPPLDPVNAMLSFAYTLLGNEIAGALESVGLDPAVGFLHTLRPGRASLALDLLEELRAPLADRFVLSQINLGAITRKDFAQKENGAYYLTDDARRAFWRRGKSASKSRSRILS